ncbi:hypothetical protein LSTR_LSTR008755 [Laodelphax striatellus]|uniref:Uncharacterized protein n=1 Tax=Laodelphax striatellus TaxID=195883 RepID=A0A482XSP2_LAOST|nr:hypothetical protein LSTR_LSTR008755 [Laodelphax striatellus]
MLKLFILFCGLLASAVAMTGNHHEAFFKQFLSHSKSHPDMSQLIVSNNMDTGSSCEIELHVTESIKGQCIQLGSTRDRGCMAGMYFEPFHDQCLQN